MEKVFKLGEVCIYRGNYEQSETLVRVVLIRNDSDGWTHKVQVLEKEGETNHGSRYWIHPRNLVSIGEENSDLINDLDTVGLF